MQSGGWGHLMYDERVGVAGVSVSTFNMEANVGETPPPGLYLVTWSVEVTTAGGAGNITALTLGFYDATLGALTKALNTANIALTATGVTTGTTAVRIGGKTPTLATTVSGATGSPVYNFRVALTKVDEGRIGT